MGKREIVTSFIQSLGGFKQDRIDPDILLAFDFGLEEALNHRQDLIKGREFDSWFRADRNQFTYCLNSLFTNNPEKLVEHMIVYMYQRFDSRGLITDSDIESYYKTLSIEDRALSQMDQVADARGKEKPMFENGVRINKGWTFKYLVEKHDKDSKIYKVNFELLPVFINKEEDEQNTRARLVNLFRPEKIAKALTRASIYDSSVTSFSRYLVWEQSVSYENHWRSLDFQKALYDFGWEELEEDKKHGIFRGINLDSFPRVINVLVTGEDSDMPLLMIVSKRIRKNGLVTLRVVELNE